MSSAARFRILCNMLAAALLVLGLARIAVAAATLSDPLVPTLSVRCAQGCSIRAHPLELLGSELSERAADAPNDAVQKITARLRDRRARSLVFAAQAATALPYFIMIAAMALALASLGRRGLGRAPLQWLRRAAYASIFWVVAQPLSDTLRSSALLPAFSGRETISVVLDFTSLFWPTLASAALWVSVWALEEARAMQAELKEYV